jgi:rare lipoprotein A
VSVSHAVATTASVAGRGALTAQRPTLDALAAAGTGLPTGYAPTGRTLSGTASWYGPGFAGRPTATGAPYDPELLTCAMRVVPLGTVVHVEANGHATDCLVNDRGPYVGDRILDMSRAGAHRLGYDGLTRVRITVLAPT